MIKEHPLNLCGVVYRVLSFDRNMSELKRGGDFVDDEDELPRPMKRFISLGDVVYLLFVGLML